MKTHRVMVSGYSDDPEGGDGREIFQGNYHTCAAFKSGYVDVANGIKGYRIIEDQGIEAHVTVLQSSFPSLPTIEIWIEEIQ